MLILLKIILIHMRIILKFHRLIIIKTWCLWLITNMIENRWPCDSDIIFVIYMIGIINVVVIDTLL